jgi:hypothetical protein
LITRWRRARRAVDDRLENLTGSARAAAGSAVCDPPPAARNRTQAGGTSYPGMFKERFDI